MALLQRGLAHFYQVAVGIAHVATDLGLVVLRRRQELCALGAPLGVDGLDVGDPDVEEAADAIAFGRRLERDRRLVVGRPAAGIDDNPAVREGHIRGLAVADRLATEDIGVEPARPLDVVGHDEVREHDAVRRVRKFRHCGVLRSCGGEGALEERASASARTRASTCAYVAEMHGPGATWSTRSARTWFEGRAGGGPDRDG